MEKLIKDNITVSVKEIKTMTRKELIYYLENFRGMACYDDESTKLLRECAIEDAKGE